MNSNRFLQCRTALSSRNTADAAVSRGAAVSDICLLCGSPLLYHDTAEEMVCSVCGEKSLGHARCAAGHYVCDRCHAAPAESAVRAVFSRTKSANPVEIAQEMMASPAVHMHGPEHHFLVGAALLAAYKNAGGEVNWDSSLDAVISRGKRVPGGFCGMAGNCGAAVSAGIFLSVVLKTTPLSTDTWALGMRLTAACLNAVAEHGGPRCCKRDSFAVLTAASSFLKQELGISLAVPERIACTFSEKNAECLKESCPYFSDSSHFISEAR